MFKKFLAVFATLLLTAGLTFVVVGQSAVAHTGDLDATAVCNPTTGNYDVTYTLTITNTSLAGETYWRTGTTSFEGTPTSNTGLTSGPVASTGAGDYTLGTISLPGNSVKAPWAYAYTTWTDGFKKGSDGGDIALAGSCTIADVPVDVLLSYMQNCPVDTTNTWRVSNPSGSDVSLAWHNASNTLTGTHTATPGDSFFETPRGTETMIISWGGGSTGVVAGSTTTDSGADLSATDPACLQTDAAASVTIVPPTCSAGAQLVLNTPTYATWGAVTGSYSVTASAVSGHSFPDGSLTKIFTGTLAGPLPSTDPSCAPTPVCIPKSAVSYTYDPATNSGVITVANVPNSTGVLCQGFWVTATSWKYTSSGVWPQIRDVVQKLPKITTPGTYPYVATVTCGQGDIYASFSAQPDPTYNLYGPNNPFTETFLHGMGFTGPNPTWVQQFPNCNGAEVTVPTAKSITECGTYGSVSVPADTAMIDYTLTGNGQTGINTVTAVAVVPYVLKNYPVGGWTFDLGTFTDCTVSLNLTYIQECAPDDDNTWRVYNPSDDTITVSYAAYGGGPAGTHDATPGYSYFTTPRASETMIITWGAAGSGVAVGSKTKAAGTDLSCIVEPKVSYQLGVCYPNGTEPDRFSSKNVYITLDNSLSEVAVTFHVVGAADVDGPDPSADIVRTVAAGATEVVETTPIWDQGGSYTVEFTVAGYTIPDAEIVIPAFEGCLDGNPGDPSHTNQTCVGGEIVGGTITVELIEGFTYTITGPNGFLWVSDTVATVDGLEPGMYEVVVTAAPGYVLTGPDRWPYEVLIEEPVNCTEPTLEGSTLTGICNAGAPYILYDVILTDPDNQATTFVASLILTDGTNTETIVLGNLVNNQLSGSVLWPGAAVDSNGFPTAWPGWEQDSNGLWVKTTNNFGWTRNLTQATIDVNPQVVVDLTYPDPTPDCGDGPPDLPDLALVTPTVSYTQPTCTAAGTYTLGELDPGTISWTVDGAPKGIGTYSIASGQITLVATPTKPLDGLDGWTNPLVLTFTPPNQAACDFELTTLALTGLGTTFGLPLAGGFILLGLGGLLIFARRRQQG